VVFKKKYNINS